MPDAMRYQHCILDLFYPGLAFFMTQRLDNGKAEFNSRARTLAGNNVSRNNNRLILELASVAFDFGLEIKVRRIRIARELLSLQYPSFRQNCGSGANSRHHSIARVEGLDQIQYNGTLTSI